MKESNSPKGKKGGEGPPRLSSKRKEELSAEHGGARAIEEILYYLKGESFHGPLPHPDHFAAYEKILPGSGERILTMAERQGEHRQHLERLTVESATRLENRGQWFAFIIGMTCVVGGMILVGLGRPIEGSATALAALAGLAGLFIWVRRDKRRELERKREVARGPLRESEEP